MTLRLGACGLSGCLAVLVLAACSGGSSVASKYVATAVIGPTGGTIPVTAADDSVLAGTSITIPAGALTTDTTISIGLSEQDVAPKGTTAAGPVVDFEPSGTVFAKPVTMTIPVTASHSLYIEAVEADGSTSVIAVKSVSDGIATFQVKGFTSFGAWTGTSTVDASVTCASNADCASGETCTDGVCGGSSTCGDGVCGSGETCSSCPADCGNCTTTVDAGAACTTDADCIGGNACISGVCALNFVDAGAGDAAFDSLSPDASIGFDAAADAPVCAAGETLCGSVCIDVSSDPDNCGACGTACPTGQICSEGVCTT